MSAVPFLPFTRPYIDEATISAVTEVLRSGWLASGPNVIAFEKALSEYVGGKPVRVVTSATGGLELVLRLCGIGAGDEVIVPALSFVASSNVIALVGAKPVFVDVELATRNMDVSQIEAAITSKTKAIMPVHFAGLPVDLDGIYALAKKYELRVIEDAAHAIGSRYKNKIIGSESDVAVYSFHPNKNITSIEGGAVVFNDVHEVEKFERMRFHGMKRLADGSASVTEIAGKFNMPDVSAVVGLYQLKALDGFNSKRRELAHHYLANLSEQNLLHLPKAGEPADNHSWHIFAPLVRWGQLSIDRSQFVQIMKDEFHIGTGIHYQSMPSFEIYQQLGYHADDYPHAKYIGETTVTLPLFPQMEIADADRVIHAVNVIFQRYQK